jgi:hypothetical protein
MVDKKTPKNNVVDIFSGRLKSPEPTDMQWQLYVPPDFTEDDMNQIDLEDLATKVSYCDTQWEKIYEYTKFIEKVSHHMNMSMDVDNLKWLEADLLQIFVKLVDKKVDL